VSLNKRRRNNRITQDEIGQKSRCKNIISNIIIIENFVQMLVGARQVNADRMVLTIFLGRKEVKKNI
jgi:hypothetical protein